jgi:hypothetical protein
VSERHCAHCNGPIPSKTLARYPKQMYCNRGCSNESRRNLFARACETCSRDYLPLGKRQRYCSRACIPSPIGQKPWRLPEFVALLRATKGQWMTVSDLAIWIYGDDTGCDRQAIRMMIWRLSLGDHRLERRQATWEARQGCAFAYRLVEHAQEAAA